MRQRIEFGQAPPRRASELLVPGLVCLAAAVVCGALRWCPPPDGFTIEWGGWLVLVLDLHLACWWFWRRAVSLRRG